ncbi:MAG: hypothetical protein M1142_04200, partial [Patescibacteria group bacterium]|nr:hypothetical protein [Patescibacteria group bacterium]
MLTNKYMEIERPEHLGGYNIIPYKERLVYILASRIFAKDPECQPAGDICWDYIQNENIQGHPRLHREQVHQFLNDLGTHLEVIFSAEQPSERTLLIYQLLNSNGKDSIIMSVFLTEPAKLEVFDTF